jgi:hypothetical protein
MRSGIACFFQESVHLVPIFLGYLEECRIESEVVHASRVFFDIKQLLLRPFVNRQVKEWLISGIIPILD